MTQENGKAVVGLALDWKLSIQPGPDGTRWVGVQIDGPMMSVVVAMPPKAAKELADNLPDALRSCSIEAERQNSPLLRAPAGALDNLKRNMKP